MQQEIQALKHAQPQEPPQTTCGPQDEPPEHIKVEAMRWFKVLVGPDAIPETAYIPTGDLPRVVRAMGMSPGQDELAEMTEIVDADGNGSIDFREFCQMMVKSRGAGAEVELCVMRGARGAKVVLPGWSRWVFLLAI